MRNLTVRERAGLAAVALALVVLAVGGWEYRQQAGAHSSSSMMPVTPPAGVTEVPARGADHAAADETAPEAAATRKAAQPRSGAPIIVYVSGAVARPGVYTLRSEDRIYKAIHAAGGFKKNAAREVLNLADRLQDGDQIHVPARGAPPPALTPPPVRAAASRYATLSPSAPRDEGGTERPHGRVLGDPPRPASPAPPSRASSATGAVHGGKAARGKSGGAGKFRAPGDGTVNLNTAGAEEIQRLPGVGPAMAARILAYRQEVGGFKSPEQLLDVKGVGEKKFAKMQPFVRVN